MNSISTMFNVMVLLVIAFASLLSASANLPKQSPQRTEQSAAINKIREILEKLYVQGEFQDRSGHGGLDPATDPPEKLIKAVRKFGRSNALPCLVLFT